MVKFLGKARQRRSKAGQADYVQRQPLAAEHALQGPSAFAAAACGAPCVVVEDNDAAQRPDSDAEAAGWDGSWEDVGSDEDGEEALAATAGPLSHADEALTVDVSRAGKGAAGGAAPKRLTFTKVDRETARLVHRSHLLCLLGRGLLYDAAADDATLQAVLLSLTPPDLASLLATPGGCAPSSLTAALGWFRGCFTLAAASALQPPAGDEDEIAAAVARARGVEAVATQLLAAVERRCGSAEELVALFAALLRAHGARARSVRFLDPSSLKPGGAWGCRAASGLSCPEWLQLLLSRPARAWY